MSKRDIAAEFALSVGIGVCLGLIIYLLYVAM